MSRSTYALWRATRTAQSGSLSFADLAADFDAAQVGADSPDLIVTTPAVFTIAEALYTPTVSHQVNEFRAADGAVSPIAALGGKQGFRALYWRGLPLVADDKCTSGNIYTLNSKHFVWYEVPQPAEFNRGSNRGFAWTGWKEAINQDAVVGQLLWYGQLVCDSPRHQARRTGVTS